MTSLTSSLCSEARRNRENFLSKLINLATPDLLVLPSTMSLYLSPAKMACEKSLLRKEKTVLCSSCRLCYKKGTPQTLQEFSITMRAVKLLEEKGSVSFSSTIEKEEVSPITAGKGCGLLQPNGALHWHFTALLELASFSG